MAVSQDNPCAITILVTSGNSGTQIERRVVPITIRFKATSGVKGDWFLEAVDLETNETCLIACREIACWGIHG